MPLPIFEKDEIMNFLEALFSVRIRRPRWPAGFYLKFTYNGYLGMGAEGAYAEAPVSLNDLRADDWEVLVHSKVYMQEEAIDCLKSGMRLASPDLPLGQYIRKIEATIQYADYRSELKSMYAVYDQQDNLLEILFQLPEHRWVLA